jgi:hypothetical protein
VNDKSRNEPAELEPAPKPLSIWDVMQQQVDRAFAEFIGGDYTTPVWGEAASGPGGRPPTGAPAPGAPGIPGTRPPE